MKISGTLKRLLTDEEGNTEVTFSINNQFYTHRIKELDKEKKYEIEIKDIKSKRSIEQNRLMWALIGEIDKEINGRYKEPWDVYLIALERAGAKYTDITIIEDAVATFTDKFRACKELNSFVDEGVIFKTIRCFHGSSTMNTKEMTELIETILDIAAEIGLNISTWKNELNEINHTKFKR